MLTFTEESSTGSGEDFGPQNAEHEGGTKCPDCNEVFATVKGMTAHRKWKHNWQHPLRSLVQEPQRPACKQNFASVETARMHLQKLVCAQSKGEEFQAWQKWQLEQREQQEQEGETRSAQEAGMLDFWLRAGEAQGDGHNGAGTARRHGS